MNALRTLFQCYFGEQKPPIQSSFVEPVVPPQPVVPATPDYSEFVDDPLIMQLDKAIAAGQRMQANAQLPGSVTAEEMKTSINNFHSIMDKATALMRIENADRNKAVGILTEEEYKERVDAALDQYNREHIL